MRGSDYRVHRSLRVKAFNRRGRKEKPRRSQREKEIQGRRQINPIPIRDKPLANASHRINSDFKGGYLG